MIRHIALAFCIHFLFILSCKAQEWTLSSEKNGITVYTKHVPDSPLNSFKGESNLKVNIDSIANLIMDVARLPEWTYRTSSTTLIRSEHNKAYFHNTTSTPPFLKNREAYFCSHLVRNEASKEVVITIRTYESKEPVPEGFIRIPYSDGRWILSPISDNETYVVFQVHAEPGGMIPAWFVNLVADESPRVTLKNLRTLLLGDKVQ